MEIKVDNIINLLKVLSWTKIIQIIVFLIIVGTSYGLWENRTIVYNSLKVGARVEVESPLIIDLSSNTTNTLAATLLKSKDLIAGIQVVNVNFKKNIRITAYFSISNLELRAAWEKFQENKIAPTPLFTEKESQNQKVIDMINGEFRCEQLQTSLARSVIAPTLTSVKTICSISIPPYYGRFSGYMNMYLLKEPTEDEMIFIRQLSRDLSLKIYELDVDKSVRY